MNISLKNKIISYFSGYIVEKVYSELNGQLFVYYINGKFILNAQNTNYSYGELHTGFKKMFRKIRIWEYHPKEVLLLGLGAGSVPSLLFEKFNIPCMMDAVEFDPVIVSLAKKYFQINRFKNLKIYREDANDFIKKCKKQYDVIVVDLYLDNKVPQKFESSKFLSLLKKRISAQGLVIFNKDLNDPEMNESYPLLKEKFLQNFPGAREVRVVKNHLFLISGLKKKS